MRGPDRRGVATVGRLVTLTLIVAAAGAIAFGLWHAVVGGLVNGNGRAASFGILLALVAAGFLGGLLAGRRAWLRGRG